MFLFICYSEVSINIETSEIIKYALVLSIDPITNIRMKQPFADIAKKYNLINDFMSLGLHRRWKRHLVGLLKKRLNPGDKILDVATGTGDVAALFGRVIDPKQVYAVDPCLPMMDEGKQKYPFLTHWYLASAEALPFEDECFAVVSCTFGVRNYKNRSIAFSEIARVLKSEGRFGILEIHPVPQNLWYFPFRLFWRMVIPLYGKVINRSDAYKYLRDSAEQFISPQLMVEELKPYFDVELKRSLIGGGLVTLIVAKKR